MVDPLVVAGELNAAVDVEAQDVGPTAGDVSFRENHVLIGRLEVVDDAVPKQAVAQTRDPFAAEQRENHKQAGEHRMRTPERDGGADLPPIDGEEHHAGNHVC